MSLGLFLLAVTVHTSLVIVVFGSNASLVMFYITMLALTFFSRWKLKIKIAIGSILTALAVGLTINSIYSAPLTEVTRSQVVFWNCANIIVNFFAAGYGIYYFSFIVDSTEQELKFEADHDVLTGVLNRNAIMKVLASGIVTGQTGTVAVIMCDIDHFKQINDTYGHLVGDEVLRNVAGVLGISLREADALGRYGGEEFIIVLPGCHLSAALGVAERIRRMVESTAIITDADRINVTMSFGVTCLQNGSEDDAERFLKAADMALYCAKNNGRNRVEYA